VLGSLENSQFAVWERGDLWGWPVTLAVHEVGTAVVVGFMFIIGLRLLGLFETVPYSSLNRLFVVAWIAFAVQLITGAMLWMTKPTRYVVDTAFVLKMLLVIAGFVLAVHFQRTIRREAAAWDAAGGVPSHGLNYVTASLLIWCGALIAGRLTAHLGSLG
jgi:hypothetical protein